MTQQTVVLRIVQMQIEVVNSNVQVCGLVHTWVQLSRMAGCTLYCSRWPAHVCVTFATAMPLSCFSRVAPAISTSLLAADFVPACAASEMLLGACARVQLHVRCVVPVTVPGIWDCTEQRPRVPSKLTSSTPSPALGSSSGAGMAAPTRVRAPADWARAAPAPVLDSSSAAADDAISIMAAPGNSARPCTCIAGIYSVFETSYTPDRSTCLQLFWARSTMHSFWQSALASHSEHARSI